MGYRLLADLVVLLHLGFVVFAVLGGLPALRWPRTAWVHVPATLWAAVVVLFGWVCPLTPLENHFRELAGQEGYAGGFVEHYLLAVLYPEGLTRRVQVVLGVLLLALNAGVYAGVWRRAARARRR